MIITEGEITSMARRFFLLNGFRFLSTLPNGEKLYYTLNGIATNKKQPDTVVFKDNLVILCEDKIKYSSSLSDQVKLTTFLTSPFDTALFKTQLCLCHGINESTQLIGCLASLVSRVGRVSSQVLPPYLIRLSFKYLGESTFQASLNTSSNYAHYFPVSIADFTV